jgi:hypothetical protein
MISTLGVLSGRVVVIAYARGGATPEARERDYTP